VSYSISFTKPANLKGEEEDKTDGRRKGREGNGWEGREKTPPRSKFLVTALHTVKKK